MIIISLSGLLTLAFIIWAGWATVEGAAQHSLTKSLKEPLPEDDLSWMDYELVNGEFIKRKED